MRHKGCSPLACWRQRMVEAVQDATVACTGLEAAAAVQAVVQALAAGWAVEAEAREDQAVVAWAARGAPTFGVASLRAPSCSQSAFHCTSA